MNTRVRVLARAVLVIFLPASALCCVPFVSFLQAGGSALLMEMEREQLTVESPTLTANEWSAVVTSENVGCQISFIWGSLARSARRVANSEHQVVEITSEVGYSFYAQNDRYTVYYLSTYPYYSEQSRLIALAQVFKSDLRVMNGSLGYFDWLREYREAANYVGNTWGSMVGRDDPNKIFALVVHLWQVMLQWLLSWQLPLLAILASCKWSALMWGWIVLEMVGALFLIYYGMRRKI